jgi:hypothetical protein
MEEKRYGGGRHAQAVCQVSQYMGGAGMHKQYAKCHNVKITMLINIGIMQSGKLLVPVS